jgi:hypothetical protein
MNSDRVRDIATLTVPGVGRVDQRSQWATRLGALIWAYRGGP